MERNRSRSLADFFDDAGDGGAGFCAHAEPFVGFFKIEGVVHAFDHGVVGAELLDVTSITACARVDGDNFIIRTIFRSLASESERYHS